MNKNHEFYHIMPAIPENMNLTRLSIFCLNCKYNNIRLWHRTVLAALRGAYSFAPAQAAIFIAVKAARVPHGPAAVVRRRRSLTNGDSRDKATCIHDWLACAFVRLRRPKAPLREPFLPRLLGDARSTLPILALACVLRGKRRARTPCPLHAA